MCPPFDVKAQFEANTHGGVARFTELMRRINAVWLKTPK
jgi:hypothetical protein